MWVHVEGLWVFNRLLIIFIKLKNDIFFFCDWYPPNISSTIWSRTFILPRGCVSFCEYPPVLSLRTEKAPVYFRNCQAAELIATKYLTTFILQSGCLPLTNDAIPNTHLLQHFSDAALQARFILFDGNCVYRAFRMYRPLVSKANYKKARGEILQKKII